jgi:hypothetical protein
MFHAQALCINEYVGLEFSCEGGIKNSVCLQTGEQVLQTLAFDKHTTAYPVFGLAMVFLGFLFVAFFVLSTSQLTFLPLGYTGSTYIKTFGKPVDSAQLASLPGVQFEDLEPNEYTSSLKA